MYIFLFLVQLCSGLALAWGGRIVGGEEAGLMDAPWQVRIFGFPLFINNFLVTLEFVQVEISTSNYLMFGQFHGYEVTIILHLGLPA
jgi:hypothetical protein